MKSHSLDIDISPSTHKFKQYLNTFNFINTFHKLSIAGTHSCTPATAQLVYSGKSQIAAHIDSISGEKSTV